MIAGVVDEHHRNLQETHTFRGTGIREATRSGQTAFMPLPFARRQIVRLCRLELVGTNDFDVLKKRHHGEIRVIVGLQVLQQRFRLIA